MANQGDNLCGGVNDIQGEDFQEAVQVLNKTLATLATGDGPSFQWVTTI